MSRPIKIAHVTTVDLSLRYLLLNQLKSLQAAGYEVTGISAPGPDVPALTANGIHHISAPLTRNVTPITDLLALGQLVKIMQREKFTIVHCHTPKAELLGQVAARLAGVPLVVDTFRGIYYRRDMHPLWRRLFITMARTAAGRADVVLSQSREAMQMAIDEKICPAEKIRFLGNGIDIHRFDRRSLKPAGQAQLRRSLSLPPDTPLVGFVGRLVREKGILELLSAARDVLVTCPDVRFLFVGPIDSDKPDALTPAIAAEYGLSDCCHFTGMRTDMPELFGLMDIFVLPSHRESFPRSPMEAAAMSLPAVLTDIPGCREVVEHDHTGLLVPLDDVPALGEAIVRLLTNPALARQLGQVARRKAEREFDEQIVFGRVKATYRELLVRKGMAAPQPITNT